MINWAQNEAENGRERKRENGGKFASVVALLEAQLNSESRQVNVDRLATCHMQLELPASVLLSLQSFVPLLLLCFYIRHKYC